MFVLFLFLGLKLHSNYGLRIGEKNGRNQETIKTENQLNSNLNEFTSKKKEGGRYKCEIIKFSQPAESNLYTEKSKRVISETDLDYEAFLKCDNANYNPNQNNVEIEGTVMNGVGKHINDHNTDALIVIKNADFRCASSIFRASASANNDAQLIHFMGEGIHTITNTDFKWCGKNPYFYRKDNERLLEDFDPTLIVFDDSSKNFISGGQFYHSENDSPQSLEIFPARCIRTKKACSLIVSGTYFYNATAYHKGSFFLLDSSEDVSIIHSHFEACYDRENFAHAICANQGMVDVKNCNFNNILMNPSSSGSIIRAETKSFNFEGNNIKFDNPSINCQCLYIPNSGTYNVLHNEFKNIEINQNGAAIYIEKPSEISFNNNEFDHLIGTGKGRALLLTFDTLEDRSLVGNKFQNIPSADGLIYIRSADEIQTNYTFDHWDLRNIHQNGGGIINVDNENNVPYGLILNECYFGNNNNTNGGALLINDVTFPNCQLICINRCSFMFNEALGKGGAISISVDADIFITGGDFNLNSAQEGGGVIYIEPSSQSQRKCSISDGTNFNRNYGLDSHAIWVHVSSFNDEFILELNSVNFADQNGQDPPKKSNSGAAVLCNCYATKVINCFFKADETPKSSGGINVTAKGILEVLDTDFTNCNAGSAEGSYGGGIGYRYGIESITTKALDERTENITIKGCTFTGGVGQNGVALLLHMSTLNVFISNVDIVNHKDTNYIFCIFFYCEADDDIFTLKDLNFTGNSYNSKAHDGDCGGSGIWIAEAKQQDYLKSLTVQFESCIFEYNYSPLNGGAFGFDTSERLKSVELVFKECQFNHNSCGQSGGALHFATKKTVELYNCDFLNNTCGDKLISGGGAINLYNTVEMVTINRCHFTDCIASKGSFMYTTGALKGFNISSCTFNQVNISNHGSTVHLDVDSSARIFIFEFNDFINLDCTGEYGGSGLHIGTGRDCEINSCNFVGNSGEGQIIIPNSSTRKLIFNNCTFKKGRNEGSRAVFIKGESSVEFLTCQFSDFNDFTEDKGRGLLVYSLSANKMPLFDNCTFSNVLCYSAFDFENCINIQISWCNFRKVQAKVIGKGGLLFIKKATQFSVTNCNLYECGSPDGTNDKPCFDLCESVETAEVINCTFEYCGRAQNGAAVSARNVTNILIHNSTFLRNMTSGVGGDTLSVYIGIGSQNCEISNCQVHTRQIAKNNIFQFRVFSSNVIFTNNLFDKYEEKKIDVLDTDFGGIYFEGATSLTMTSNMFSTRNTAVYAKDIVETVALNNTWTKAYGEKGTGPRAFYIKSTELEFRNNTVRDCPHVKNHIMSFSSRVIVIEDCHFINNTYMPDVNREGGGIGMRFECKDFSVTFRNCLFRDNNGNLGGALQFGAMQTEFSNSTGSIEIVSCIFESNVANVSGGALVFTSKKNNIVQNCVFTGNKANGGISGGVTGKGGAICILTSSMDSNYVNADERGSTNTIINCQFDKNSASLNGHSIFHYSQARSFVKDCTFTSEFSGNSGGMVACQRENTFNSSGLLEVANSTFECTSSADGYSGIEILDYGISKIYNCYFNNLQTSEFGNAINLFSNGPLNEIHHNAFNNCASKRFIIFCDGRGFDFHHNEFNCDSSHKSCGFMRLKPSLTAFDYHIHFNHFHDFKDPTGTIEKTGKIHFDCGEGPFQKSDVMLCMRDNIFENLNSDWMAALYIKANRDVNINFNNNSIQNNQPGKGVYLFGFDFQGTGTPTDIITISNSKFINNTCSSLYGGGIGIRIQNSKSRTFQFMFKNCIFEGNHAEYAPDNEGQDNYINGKGGAFQIGFTKTTSQISPIFDGCNFKSNQADNDGGALSFTVVGIVTIRHCTFTENTAGVKPTDPTNNGLGGAIYFDPDNHVAFDNNNDMYNSDEHLILDSLFRGNYAPVAAAIYVTAAKHTHIQIGKNCQFIDNGLVAGKIVNDVIYAEASQFTMSDSLIKYSNPSASSPRGIKILGQANIQNVFFSNIKGDYSDNSASSIFVSESASSVKIDSCIFSECGVNRGASGSSIVVRSSDSTEISKSTFNFTNVNTACGALRIFSGYISILNNYFYKMGGEGTLYYKEESSSGVLNLEGNTFDNILSSTKAVYLIFATENVRIYNNTIENMQDAKYIFQCQLQNSDIKDFNISHCTFRNLVCSSQFGGGAGLWVQKAGNAIFNFVIDECTFENSYAKYTGADNTDKTENGYGGGLQFGVTESESNTYIRIQDCVFKGNKADRCGGALSLGLKYDFTIENCIFANNIGGLDNNYYGGALFIDHREPNSIPESVTISHCTFRNNTAPDGNAIYITNLPNTDIFIQDNTIFEDNCKEGKHSDLSAVKIDSQGLIIDSCTFSHTTYDKSSRAVEASSITTKISNSLFTKCSSGVIRRANAIWVKENVLSCHIENCDFIDNAIPNSRGDVIVTETKDFLFESSTIKFTEKEIGSRGLFVMHSSMFNVLNSSFIKCKNEYQGDNTGHTGGAIEYHGNSHKVGYIEDIRIEKSTFDSNRAQTSNILFYVIGTFPILNNLTFKGSDRGLYTLTIFFDFLPQEEFAVENIIFENNYFTNLDGGGSGIWIAQFNPAQTTRSSWPLTFNKCTFKNNRAKQSGGAVAYGNSDTLTLISLTFNECQFIENKCEGTNENPGGGALWFNSQETVNVSNCVFTGNQALKTTTRATSPGGKGHAIYAAPRSLITVENCKFIDNGADGIESVIQMSGQQFNLTNSEISFTKSGSACRGVYIDFPGIVNIRNTKFKNCGKSSVGQGGGILYKDANTDSVLEEQISIEGCTFDNCLADNGCAMLFWASVPPTLNGNEIKNQISGKYVISIFYTSFQDYSIVENMNFVGGTNAKEDGGASGIWIANNQDISNGRPSELIFRNCKWEDNYSPNKGGALHYGNSKTLIGTELTFEDCRFINNRAKDAGGAVSIATISPTVFRNCEFNGNIVERNKQSNTKGSAIYVDSETPLCLVSGCTFTNSSADEGNAIYATSKVLALHVTDNTKIRNCGSSGSCIAIESKEFFFLNSQITFDNINKAARGICIKTLSVTKISDSKFVKCSTPLGTTTDKDKQGGAIFIDNTVDTDSLEEVQLLYSTFDACRAANGCAIMFWIETNPIIKGNTITNHNYNKYIFTIIRKTNFADQFTIENCTFVKNKFSNKQMDDGGGAAIWIANQQFFNEGELAQLLFKDCNWTKNTGVYGGAFSYGKSNTVKYIQLEFQNCHFENNQATGPQGGALHITTVSPVTITGCTFYNNKCVNNIQNLAENKQALGGAVYFDTNSTFVNVINTTFRKNSAQNGNAIFVSQKAPYIEIQDTHFLSNSNGNVGAQVAHQGVELRAKNTNFDYQVVTLHSKGVDILSKSITIFTDCNFTLCETPYDKGGALFVQDQINSPNNEKLELESCIFDNCNSSEGSSIYASLSTAPKIYKCTIKNNNQGCSVFVLIFTNLINEIIIENCEFIDNEYLNSEEKPDCGGSGIWISNVGKIVFRECDFVRNKADYVGGALAYGHDNELSDISLQFEVCYFNENVCNGKYGGALYLVNSQETLITGCVFTNNQPLASNERKGGDVYIDGKSGKVNIANSVFESMSTQVEEGNAIYCSSNAEHLIISATTFHNCGKAGTVIVSNAKENTFNNANLMFDEATNEKSARGLAIYLTSESTSTIIKDCTFVNCFFNTQSDNLGGGGIYIKHNGEGATTHKLELENCAFEGTTANQGAAFYLDICSALSLKDIKVTKCTSSTNILYIKYTNSAESTLFNNCQFIENQLTSSNDGGGSGILISQVQKLSFSGCTFIGNTAAGSGGAFAYYNGQDAKNTELEFNGCTFNGNNAHTNGGALYLDTNRPILITGCTFDNNTANGNSGAIYVHSTANIKIELTNIARNKASSKNAALYINNAQTLEFNNNTISDNNCPSSPSSVEINNDGTANIAENNFDFTRQSGNQYQISLTGSSQSAVANFRSNCFTHKGDVNDNNLIHILSTHAGQVNIPAGNCFDSGQYNSLQHNGGTSSVGENVFDCKQCGDIYVPTAAPEATPTASRQMTSKPTDIPVPTEKPYIPTPVATSPPSSSGESTIPSSSSSSSSSNNNNQNTNKGKKRSVQIAMIAGITAAIVVVICVVIILLWLFIFRKRRSNNSPQGGMDSNIPSTNDDTVSGVNTTPQDDPIWAGATATHDNPLFNGSEDQDDDQMVNTGFEESWGENVI